MAEVLYLTILSRFPTPEELKTVEGYGRAQPGRPEQMARSRGTNSVAAKSAASDAVPAKTEAKETESTVRSPQSTAQSSNTVAVKSNQPPRVGPLGSLGPRSKPSDKPAVPKRRDDWMDITWSLINSEEFLYRH